MDVRPLTPADAVALEPLLRAFGHVFDDSVALERRVIQFCSSEAHGLLGAFVEGELIGYALVQDYGPHLRAGDRYRTARLHDLFVLEARREGGVGRALFGAVQAWCRSRPIRFLEWQAGGAARAFYERLGHLGEPCPQPEYPTFEIDFGASVGST